MSVIIDQIEQVAPPAATASAPTPTSPARAPAASPARDEALLAMLRREQSRRARLWAD